MKDSGEFTFQAVLWEHPGAAAWHFVTMPADLSDDIAELTEGRRGGFGSVRVRARVGGTVWETSLFPDRAAAAYLLPVKKPVRMAEALTAGDELTVRVKVTELRDTELRAQEVTDPELRGSEAQGLSEPGPASGSAPPGLDRRREG